jgi:hypothetical protein
MDDAQRLKEWTEKIDAWRRAKGAWMTAGGHETSPHDELDRAALTHIHRL